SYTVAVIQPEWATIKITPSSTIVLEAGKSQTLYVAVEAGKKAPLGAQVLAATISSSGESIEQLTMTANVTKASGSLIRTILEVILVAFVVILLIIGLIIGLNKLRSNDDDEKPKTETYY
ncbi:MAG: hypothetical protein QW666_04090, partial [Candidatus Woesearchaeota archaeon]